MFLLGKLKTYLIIAGVLAAAGYGLWKYYQYNQAIITAYAAENAKKEVVIKVSRSEIFPENWNAQWESKFDPIFIGDECVIRADFHENQDKKFELIITKLPSAKKLIE